MTTVGIIANPISGKDIRRLVAHGSVFDNQEKVRIVRRVLSGLEAVGVRRIAYMPDEYAIVPRALRGCRVEVTAEAIPIVIENNQDDSTRAGQWMERNGIDCVVVLGGDGTCRAVAKAVVEVPLLPLSTGTNNVFPYLMEATVAGLAAGLAASGQVPREVGCYRSCRLEILEDGAQIDIALVDVAVYRERFIAARAIWDMSKVARIFLTRARPDAIGLSSVGGRLRTIDARHPAGLHLELGDGGRVIKAPIAPGLLQDVSVRREQLMEIGTMVGIDEAPCVLALDGEREVEVRRAGRIVVRLSDQGPYVVDVERTMAFAQTHQLF